MLEQTVTRHLTRSPLIAAVLYVGVLASLLVVIGLAVSDIVDHRQALAQTSELLDQIRGRKVRVAGAVGSEHPGTPFLEGPTVTVAGAALLQRGGGCGQQRGWHHSVLTGRCAGNAGQGRFCRALVSCEMEQPALQKVLYDLEAGMPFLFIDQLDVQVPQTTAVNEGGTGRVRVVIGVSGQWQQSRQIGFQASPPNDGAEVW